MLWSPSAANHCSVMASAAGGLPDRRHRRCSPRLASWSAQALTGTFYALAIPGSSGSAGVVQTIGRDPLDRGMLGSGRGCDFICSVQQCTDLCAMGRIQSPFPGNEQSLAFPSIMLQFGNMTERAHTPREILANP